MYLKINGIKLNVKVCSDFKSRFKSLKFYLNEIDFALYFPKRKLASTYFFCQRVDICFTDADNKIIYLAKNVRSEKFYFKLKSKGFYIFPVGACNFLKIGDKINLQN